MTKHFFAFLSLLIPLSWSTTVFANVDEPKSVHISSPVNEIDNRRLTREFNEQFLTVINQLELDGITSINEVPLKDLKDSVRGTKVQFVNGIAIEYPERHSAVRRGAYWDAEQNVIYVSSQDLIDPGLLAVHERVGIKQGGDWEFSKSAEIRAYLKLREISNGRTIESSLALNKIRDSLQLRQGRGGVTGVGGGGDFLPILFKSDLIYTAAILYDTRKISEKEFEWVLFRAQITTVEVGPSIEPGKFLTEKYGFLISPDSYRSSNRLKTEKIIREVVAFWIFQYRNP